MAEIKDKTRGSEEKSKFFQWNQLKNANLSHLPAGFYEISFSVEIKDFDKEILFADVKGVRTGPWDYAYEDGKNIKKYQLLLPLVELSVSGKKAGESGTFIPNETELSKHVFTGIIGFENKITRSAQIKLQCINYRNATCNVLNIREIKVFKDSKPSSFYDITKRFWLNDKNLSDIKKNWHRTFRGANIDRILNRLSSFNPPQNMKEARIIASRVPQDIKAAGDNVTLAGNYIACLCLRILVFNLQKDRKQLLRWVDAITSLPHWGIGKSPNGADYDNDLSVACNMFGLGVASNWLPEVLGIKRQKKIRKKIYKQTKQLVDYVKSCRSSWPGSNSQNHAFFGYQSILLGGLILLKHYNEAIDWVNIAAASFKRLIKHLPDDGSYHEGVGYIPFALYGLAPSLLLLEEVTATKWFPVKWLAKHWGFCGALMPSSFKTGFYIDDNSNGLPTFLPLAFRELYNPLNTGKTRNAIRSIIGPIWEDQRDRVAGSVSLLENFWGMLWSPLPYSHSTPAIRTGKSIRYEYFRESGIFVISLDKDSKLYFFTGPPHGYKISMQDRHRYGYAHHHPDTGNILLNMAGDWILADTGHSYNKKGVHHNILTLEDKGQYHDGYVYYHPLPDNIVPPVPAIKESKKGLSISVDFSPYYPPERGLCSWIRTLHCCVADSKRRFVVEDQVGCKKATTPCISWGSDFPWIKKDQLFQIQGATRSINFQNGEQSDIILETIKKSCGENWFALRMKPPTGGGSSYNFRSVFTFE